MFHSKHVPFNYFHTLIFVAVLYSIFFTHVVICFWDSLFFFFFFSTRTKTHAIATTTSGISDSMCVFLLGGWVGGRPARQIIPTRGERETVFQEYFRNVSFIFRFSKLMQKFAVQI